MKVLVVADVHGDPSWKEILAYQQEYDHIVFLGDYVDSLIYKPEQMIINLMDIIRFKKENPERVTLLVGNHDAHYMKWLQAPQGSGYSQIGFYRYYMAFSENEPLFEFAKILDGVLYTHAGATYKWVQNADRHGSFSVGEFDADPVSAINSAGWYRNIIGIRRGGSYDSGGPLWADAMEHSAQHFAYPKQVVGHTPVKVVSHYEDDENLLVFADHQQKSVTIIDNGQFAGTIPIKSDVTAEELAAQERLVKIDIERVAGVSSTFTET